MVYLYIPRHKLRHWLCELPLTFEPSQVGRPTDDRAHHDHPVVGGGEEVRWLVTASGRGWGLRGCRQDCGGQGSCSHHSGSDFAVGGPACSALCSHVRSVGRGGWKARREGLWGGGGTVGRRGVRLAGEQWAICAAKLTLARAGGGEDKKKARSCRDSMTLC